MEQHRVLLVCGLPLLCEGVQRIIQSLDDMQLVALDCLAPDLIASCLHDFAPATVVIATEGADDAAARLISDILNHWPNVSVIWIELATNVLRVYTSKTMPANSQQLIGAIRQADLASEGRRVRAKAPRRR